MIIYEQLVRIRQKEILDEAERYRLISMVKPSPVRPRKNYSRMMTWIGNLFIIWGTKLTKRFGEKNIIIEPGVADNQIQSYN